MLITEYMINTDFSSISFKILCVPALNSLSNLYDCNFTQQIATFLKQLGRTYHNLGYDDDEYLIYRAVHIKILIPYTLSLLHNYRRHLFYCKNLKVQVTSHKSLKKAMPIYCLVFLKLIQHSHSDSCWKTLIPRNLIPEI